MKKANTIASLVMVLIAALVLSGCKGAYEKRGDEHLQEGRLRNALKNYMMAEEQGKISDEFHDNHAVALSRMVLALVKDNPTGANVRGYADEIKNKEENLKDPAKIKEVASNLAQAAKIQIANNYEMFGMILEGFQSLETAEALSKKAAEASAEVEAVRKEAEEIYTKQVLKMAEDMSNNVAKEYQLLLGQHVMPKNETIAKELNEVRKKNRGDFLIFQAAGIDRPSPKVETNSYVIAFPSLKIGPTSMSGELQAWNSSGNNTTLSADKITLVGTNGESVTAKQTGVGDCMTPELDKNKDYQNKRKRFNSGEALFITEGQCSMVVTFEYQSGFVPDYVMIKDQFGRGRKYLGYDMD